MGSVTMPPLPNSPPHPTSVPLDPLREAAHLRIKVLDLPGGGKEFILPALRNLRMKLTFLVLWAVFAASLPFAIFVLENVASGLPSWIRWVVVDHGLFALLPLVLIVLVLTLACLDRWLRSSRVIATPGELQVVTHWLLVKRTNRIPASKIIETKIENTTTAGETRYYSLIVLALGDKPGWIARNFPMRPKPGSGSAENNARVFNSGGKRISAATGIEGEAEAQWLLGQLREALGIKV
jgi:hypothetical protein